MSKPSDSANPDCEECEGTGIVDYVFNGDDTLPDCCNVCLPDLCLGDFGSDEDRYDED